MPRDRIAPLERGNEARLPSRHRFGHGDGPEPGEWVARAEGAGHACPEMAAWVKPVVEQTQAEPILERLARGGRVSLRRLLSAKESRHRVALTYFPCRLVHASASESSRELVMLVNGLSKQVFQFRVDVPRAASGGGRSGLAYALSDEETLGVVREALLQWQLGRVADAGLHSDSLRLGDRIHYPFWVRLGESRKGRMSLAMIDAVSGQPGGLAIKQAYLTMIRSTSTSTPGGWD